jgi:hypothetical protein
MKNKVYWETREGLKLDVDLMADTHVRNAFKMLVKQLNEAKKAKCVEERKVEMNGDMANEFHNSFPKNDDHEEYPDMEFF